MAVVGVLFVRVSWACLSKPGRSELFPVHLLTLKNCTIVVNMAGIGIRTKSACGSLHRVLRVSKVTPGRDIFVDGVELLLVGVALVFGAVTVAGVAVWVVVELLVIFNPFVAVVVVVGIDGTIGSAYSNK